MYPKKSFKIYYLLLTEGSTEFNLFAYLTKVRFKKLFAETDVSFSDKVNLTEVGVSKGNLGGISSTKDFKTKNDLIKKQYAGQKLFFMLDKDLSDSLDIENLIKQDGNIVQFVEHNFEYLLLKLGNRNPKEPSDFKNLNEFRDYCKREFSKQFQKNSSDFKKDSDFDLIFGGIEDEEIYKCFHVLFSLTTTQIRREDRG
jgi:hypothetical protein